MARKMPDTEMMPKCVPYRHLQHTHKQAATTYEQFEM